MEEEDDVRFHALFQKVREKELNARHGKGDKKQQKDKNNHGGVIPYRWVKFAVYLWAGRLGLTVFGGGIPALFAFFNWQSTTTPASQPSGNMTNSYELIKAHDWLTLLKHDFKEVLKFRTANEPQWIRNVSTISKDSLFLLTQSILTAFPIQIKVSTSSSFAYFTSDRVWASYLQPSYTYQSVQDFLSETNPDKFQPYLFLDSLKKGSGTQQLPTRTETDAVSSQQCISSTRSKEGPQHLYLSYPKLKPYLESFAPSLALLAKYFHPKDSEIGASLWMASTNVSAVMHYDLEDNFLLQLSGTKEVVLASPEAVHVVKPFSSLHPLWRQSSQSNLVTHDTLMSLYHQQVEDSKLDIELKELQRKIEETKERKRMHKNSQLLNPETEEQASSSSNAQTSPDVSKLSFRSWKVTLHPGEMLFIPAGFYHAVVTGADSVSVNAWFPSELSAIHSRLSSIPLPFYANDPASIKVADVVVIMHNLCTQLGKDKNCLAEVLADRYSDSIMTPLLVGATCPTIPSQEFCLENTLALAEKKGSNRRVAHAIHANLVKAGLSEPLQLQASIEYVEEILLLIFKNKELSPCKMEQLLRECWY